jgi:hypothetical protein
MIAIGLQITKEVLSSSLLPTIEGQGNVVAAEVLGSLG